MALSLIVGKPGSGKSYYAVKRIIQELVDWCVFERDNNESYERIIYTNLILNLDRINEYVSNSIGENVDVSKYIFFMDNDFFFDIDRSEKIVRKKRWWQELPESAFCVIDEVHHYLGADSTRDDKDFIECFRNYMSTHRHFKHDHIFITQHTDSIQRSVLAMAVDAYHIINVKNKVVPLLNIPFSDIDVVKESFGISHQYIQILYGNYLSRSFKRESVFYEILNPSIFALYKSHTLTCGKAEDRPSLRMSPIKSIFWFLARHGFWLGFKFGFCVFCFFVVWHFLISFPGLFGNLFHFENKKNDFVESLKTVENVQLNKENKVDIIEKKLVNNKILGYVGDGVLTDLGVKKIGEIIVVDGEKRVIKSVDIIRGVVEYED